MLERAASSLELCAARRILYRPTRRAHSRQRLPPTFWNHATAALELSAAWVALRRARAPAGREPTRRPKQLSTRYDALESLYLSGTRPLSTTPRSPFSPDSHDNLPSPSLLQSRSITNSAPYSLLALPRQSRTSLSRNTRPHSARRPGTPAARRHMSNVELRGSVKPRDSMMPGDSGKLLEGCKPMDGSKPEDESNPVGESKPVDESKLADDRELGHQNPCEGSLGPDSTKPRQRRSEELLRAMRQPGNEHTDLVWKLYRMLPNRLKRDYRDEVFNYYFRRISPRPPAAKRQTTDPPERARQFGNPYRKALIPSSELSVQRCYQIASELCAPRQREESLSDAVRSAIQRGDGTNALRYLKAEVFRERLFWVLDHCYRLHGLQTQPQPAETSKLVEVFVHSCFETGSWSLLREMSAILCTRPPQVRKLPTFESLDCIPNLESLVLKLRRYIRGRTVRHKRSAAADDAQDSGGPEAHISPPSDSHLPEEASTLGAGVAAEVTSSPKLEQHLHGITQSTLEIASAPEEAVSDDAKFAAFQEIFMEAMRRILIQQRTSDGMALIAKCHHHRLYSYCFAKTAEEGRTHQLSEMYREYERLVAPKSVQPEVLQTMFNALYPYDSASLLGLHVRFCRLYYEDKPSRDPSTLRAWWKDYAVRAVISAYPQNPLAFQPYIEEFKRRGDSDMVEFAMNVLTAGKPFQPAGISSWHVELDSYAKQLDYEGAMNVWQFRFNSNKPDRLTLITLLRLASERGDVAFTTGLFDKAKSWGLDREPEVLIPVIRAFGRHRSPREAANICAWAMSHGVRNTQVYNAALELYASSYRFHELRGLMAAMAENKIAWDDKTLLHLIKVLGRTGRGLEAVSLLKEKAASGVLGISPERLEAAMAGVLKMGNYKLVYQLARYAREKGMPMTLNTSNLLAKAAHRWTTYPDQRPVPPEVEGELVTPKDLVNRYWNTVRSELLAKAAQGHEARVSTENVEKTTADASQRGETSRASEEKAAIQETLVPTSPPFHSRISSTPTTLSSSEALANLPPSLRSSDLRRVAYTLAQVGDGKSLHNLARLYLNTLNLPVISERSLPSYMLTALMKTEFDRGDYERVKHLWELLWDRYTRISQRITSGGARQKTAPRVPPRLQYGLDDAFRVMEQVYTEERNPVALLRLINKITTAGFMLGQRAWNQAIIGLAKLGKWKDAFKLNEKMLMPYWTGWRHYRRYKNLRRRQQAWEKQANQPEGEELPENDPTLPPEERKDLRDHRLVAHFLSRMHNLRNTRRMQKERKLSGTSINLSPRIRDPGRNPRYLRPYSTTLHELARTYFQMDESNWLIGNSHEWLSMFCPISVLAIKTLRFADEVEVGRELERRGEFTEGEEPWEEESEDTERSREEVDGGAERASPDAKQVHRWKEKKLPEELREAIKNVLSHGESRKSEREARRRERRKEEKKALRENRDETIEERKREKLEREAMEEARASWMRMAGIVEDKATKPLTTGNFFGGDAEEGEAEAEEGGESAEEIAERERRRLKHRNRKLRK